VSYIDPDNDWISPTARAALDAEYNRPNSWAEFAAEGGKAAQAEVEIWKRLANDPAMETVYKNLDALDEHRLADFLDAAWGARMGNLSEIRKGRAHTPKLVPEIGEKALELKALLDQIDGSLMVPSELLSVVSLLQSAEADERKEGGWLGRRYMVGEKPSDSPSEPSDAPTEVEIKIVAADPSDPAPERNELDPYFWSGAPTVPNLLKAMADAAEDWKKQADAGTLPEQAPSSFHSAPLEAALSGDKSNERTEYLRALVTMLEGRGLLVRAHVKPEMRRAIVGVARVVLEYTNDSDPTLFEDALTRALNRVLESD